MHALFGFCFVAFLTTLGGSLVPLLTQSWGRQNLWRFLAFSSGLLLGIAFVHLMPEAFALSGRWAGMSLLATFTLLFAAEDVTMVHACEDFLKPPSSPVVPISALIALTIHAGVDGMAIGVGLRRSLALGGVISLGVVLHKFSDGLTLSSLLRASGYTRSKQWVLAVLLALATPLGAFLSFYWSGPFPATGIGIILGVATGSFLYVGAADLLPRLHEAHDRGCLIFFILGTLVVSFLP